jgi:hypothetical protein
MATSLWRDTDADAYGNTECDADCNTNNYGYADRNCDPESDGNPNSDSYPDAPGDASCSQFLEGNRCDCHYLHCELEQR